MIGSFAQKIKKAILTVFLAALLISAVVFCVPSIMSSKEAKAALYSGANLKVGDYIYFGRNNRATDTQAADLRWRVISMNATGGDILVRLVDPARQYKADGTYSTRASFSKAGDKNSYNENYKFSSDGTNLWYESDTRIWLNTDRRTVESNQNNAIKPFKQNFSAAEWALIQTNKKTQYLSQSDYDGYQAYLAACTEEYIRACEEKGEAADLQSQAYLTYINDKKFLGDVQGTTFASNDYTTDPNLSSYYRYEFTDKLFLLDAYQNYLLSQKPLKNSDTLPFFMAVLGNLNFEQHEQLYTRTPSGSDGKLRAVNWSDTGNLGFGSTPSKSGGDGSKNSTSPCYVSPAFYISKGVTFNTRVVAPLYNGESGTYYEYDAPVCQVYCSPYEENNGIVKGTTQNSGATFNSGESVTKNGSLYFQAIPNGAGEYRITWRVGGSVTFNPERQTGGTVVTPNADNVISTTGNQANDAFTYKGARGDYFYVSAQFQRLYTVTVTGGSVQNNKRISGETTQVFYDPPSIGKVFSHFRIVSGTGASIDNETSVLTVGTSDVTVEAVYIPDPAFVTAREILQAEIDKASDLIEDDYTEETWLDADLENEISLALSVLNDEDATLEDLTLATDRLRQAIGKLEEKPEPEPEIPEPEPEEPEPEELEEPEVPEVPKEPEVPEVPKEPEVPEVPTETPNVTPIIPPEGKPKGAFKKFVDGNGKWLFVGIGTAQLGAIGAFVTHAIKKGRRS